MSVVSGGGRGALKCHEQQVAPDPSGAAGGKGISSSPSPSGNQRDYNSYEGGGGYINYSACSSRELRHAGSDKALRDDFSLLLNFLENKENKENKNYPLIFEKGAGNDTCIICEKPFDISEIDRFRRSSKAIVSKFSERLLYDLNGKCNFYDNNIKDADLFLNGRACLLLNTIELDIDDRKLEDGKSSGMDDWKRKILTVNDTLDLRNFIKTIKTRPLDVLENNFVSNCKGDNVKSYLRDWKEDATRRLSACGWVQEDGCWKLPSKVDPVA